MTEPAVTEPASTVLGDAEAMLERGSWLSASNRAYYAMFYAARQYLQTRYPEETRNVKKHSGVITKFSELAVMRDGLASELGADLATVAQNRVSFDYTAERVPTEEDARRMVETARRFVPTVLVALETPQ